MINLILVFGILLVLAFLIYDQFFMDRWKGKTLHAFPLKAQAKTDSLILLGLICLSFYQGLQSQLSALTVFLLCACLLLCIYSAFLRSPRLLLKEKGFFFGNWYFDYQKIQQVHFSQDQIYVFDLKQGRRLLVRLKNPQDIQTLAEFFGGFKQ